MTDSRDIAVAVLLGLLSITITLRRWRASSRRLRPDLAELGNALKAYDRDPTQGQPLIDSLMAKEAAREQAERAELWARAQTHPKAAQQLIARLREDLAANEAARNDLRAGGGMPPGGEVPPRRFEELDEEDRKIQEQLAQLELMVKQLRQQ